MKRSDKESAAADALDELLKKLTLVDEKLDALAEKWANVEASFDEARSGNDGDGKTSTSSDGGDEKTRRNENAVEGAASPLEKSEKSESKEKKGRNRDEATADEPFNGDAANGTSFSGPGGGTSLAGVAAGLAAWSILKDEKSEKNAASSGGWRERDAWDFEDDADEDDWDSDDEDGDDWDSDDGGVDDFETGDSDWGDFDLGGGFDFDFGDMF
ncbi:MAG: hypothetical protein IJE97_11980 [Thermoguttaceae bacterium]|nr:hypothetical protein [Thermoguttaceae bacterium]